MTDKLKDVIDSIKGSFTEDAELIDPAPKPPKKPKPKKAPMVGVPAIVTGGRAIVKQGSLVQVVPMDGNLFRIISVGNRSTEPMTLVLRRAELRLM